MTQPDDAELVTALRDAALALTGKRSIRDVATVLADLVHAAVDTVPHAAGGGVSRTDAGRVRSSSATSDDVHRLDRLQSELGEGPCVTAADDPPDSGIVVAHDLAGPDGPRWPRFAPEAVRAGYRSILSVQLSLHSRRHSALNLYAAGPYVFDAVAQRTAGLFGLQAAMLLHGAEHAAELNVALTTRDQIGQAKGVLMERFGVDDNEAFQMLVRSSQETNVKLVDVARWLARDAATRRERTRPRADP